MGNERERESNENVNEVKMKGVSDLERGRVRGSMSERVRE